MVLWDTPILTLIWRRLPNCGMPKLYFQIHQFDTFFKMELTHIRTWTIFHICFFITFLASSFIINIIQAVLYISIGLFNKSLYRTINNFFVWQIHAQVFYKMSAPKFLLYVLGRGWLENSGTPTSILLLQIHI